MIALEKLDLPQYGSFTSRIFPYYGKHFHTVELDKTMEIGFSNLFLQYFPNISILWKRSILSSVGLYRSNNQFWKITSLYIHRTSLYIHCTSLHTSLYIRHSTCMYVGPPLKTTFPQFVSLMRICKLLAAILGVLFSDDRTQRASCYQYGWKY